MLHAVLLCGAQKDTGYSIDGSYAEYAVAGATVVGGDVRQEKPDLAKRLGATYTVDASAEDPARAIQAFGGADVAIALTVNPTAIQQAHASLRPGGRLVLVSLPKAGELTVPARSWVNRDLLVSCTERDARQNRASRAARRCAGVLNINGAGGPMLR